MCRRVLARTSIFAAAWGCNTFDDPSDNLGEPVPFDTSGSTAAVSAASTGTGGTGGGIIIGTAGTAGGISVAPEPIDPTLVRREGCSIDTASLRAQALERMNRTVDSAFVTYLNLCLPQNYNPTVTVNGGSGVVVPPSAPTAPTDAPRRFTETNVQEAGVDEPDFIKTDGEYFYVATGGQVVIIDAWPPEAAAEVSRIGVPGEARALFVRGDRLVVYARLFASAPDSFARVLESLFAKPCTYGYSCDVRGDGSQTWIGIFDIANREAPELLRELESSGSFLSARRIGASVHTLMDDGIRLPPMRFVPEPVAGFDPSLPAELACVPGLGFAAVQALFRDLHDENARIIAEAPRSAFEPRVSDSASDDPLEPCERPYTPESSEVQTLFRSTLSMNLLTLASLDLDEQEAASLTSVETPPGTSYASEDAYYVAVRTSQLATGVPSGAADRTLVHKFALRRASTRYAASGAAKGRVLNQFALDERDGVLRLAATSSFAPNPDAHSTVSLLEERDGRLEVIGMVDNLAPTEDIRSARFVADRGYVVTFKKTDPLFVLDLAEPTSPRVLSELKVPGFSTYIHPIGHDRLLTVGYDADDQGSFAWFTGIRLQLFDVGEPTLPALLDVEVIGTRGSSSEALTNHLAFTFAEDEGLLALPLTVCENSAGGGAAGETLAFSGLAVYQVSDDSGFDLSGRVEHPPLTETAEPPDCFTWWSEATSAVKRSFFFDDYVYSASNEALKLNALGRLEEDVRVIPFGESVPDAK